MPDQPGPTVPVPVALLRPALLADIERLAVRQSRVDGGSLATVATVRFLRRLAEAVNEADGMADDGHTPDGPPTMSVGDGHLAVAEAARRVGLSNRQVRRLALTGQVTARRVGPVWLVDLDDLHRHLRGDPPP